MSAAAAAAAAAAAVPDSAVRVDVARVSLAPAAAAAVVMHDVNESDDASGESVDEYVIMAGVPSPMVLEADKEVLGLENDLKNSDSLRVACAATCASTWRVLSA